jgi:dTDP-4-dehydrorhamnose reductase
MILLLGASGYFGRAFAGELRRRGHSFIPLTRRAFDYTRFDFLFDYLRTMKPVFVINAANFCGASQESDCETEREQAMSANALLPQMIARVCLMTKTPWGHVSSGCIYNGGKVIEDGHERIEKDLGQPEIRQLFAAHPERFRGFNEQDEANFSFRHPPCSFYSGTKALAEEAIHEIGQCYIWRLRLPFNERDEPCNLLCQQPESMDDAINSLSHVEDCVKACLDLWEIRAPFGIYNVTNPGAVAAREIIQAMPRPAQTPPLPGGERPPASLNRTPRSNCILDVSKLLQTGVKIRTVNEAMEESLARLRTTLRTAKTNGGHQLSVFVR